ncbi:MAG TPA: DUF374 domain-containing protein [Fibrobacteria bacterium]|nr:DUF374 domain-containing protein [Fibrobacteria bacterium]
MRSLLLGLGCLWLRTLRVRWKTADAPGGASRHRFPPAHALPGRAVILLWHEHLPACIRAFSHRGIGVLISRSADGAWAADACARFGYRVHRGSSSRGSMGGMKALARGMEDGSGLAGMALDGPRGPRRVPKDGSLWLARHAQAPVLPVWVEARSSIRLRSWDRCVIPLPFSKVIVHLGAAFHPESVEEIAEAMEGVERRGRGGRELRETGELIGNIAP